MSNLIPFNFGGADVRVITIDDEPWFVARDVADVLGYSNINDAIGRHCKGVVKRDLPTASGVQSLSVIPERDVYRLVMRSKLPAAEKFEEWVVGEVLPSIRKTGSFGATDPIALLNDPAAMRGLLLNYSEKVLTLETKVAEQAPKVEALDRISASDGDACVRDAAKMLHIPERRFIASLIVSGWAYRRQSNGRLVGYSDKEKAGYLTHRVHTITHNDGTQESVQQLLITPKGLVKLAETVSQVEAVQ